jgi:hypothetical protein
MRKRISAGRERNADGVLGVKWATVRQLDSETVSDSVSERQTVSDSLLYKERVLDS